MKYILMMLLLVGCAGKDLVDPATVFVKSIARARNYCTAFCAGRKNTLDGLLLKNNSNETECICGDPLPKEKKAKKK